MRKLTSGEFSRLMSSQTNTFNCKCSLVKVTIGNSDYGDVTETTNTIADIDCGFYETGGAIKHANQIIPIEYDAIMRLPLSVDVGINDQITITNLNGTGTTLNFKLKTYPKLGESVQTLQLVRMSS